MDVFVNYWKKEKEHIIIKIVDWAHRNNIKVEDLKKNEMVDSSRRPLVKKAKKEGTVRGKVIRGIKKKSNVKGAEGAK